jgi:hypothetical protein
VPQTVLIALAVMIKNQTGGNLSMADSSFGVMRFTGSDLDPVMRTLLTRVDLFAIWSAVLVAIGLIHVVRMEKSKAIIAAAIVWALIAVPSLAGAAFSPR